MSTDDNDYFKVIVDARLKLEEDTALAMPCIVREDSGGKPQTCAPSIDAGEEPSDSENTGACRKGEAKTNGPHCRKRARGKLSLWRGTQASFYSRSFAENRSQSRRG